MIQLIDKALNKIYDLFEFIIYEPTEPKIERTDDLIPKGIKSTVKSDTYGNPNDFNNTWRYIYSQRRNLSKIK